MMISRGEAKRVLFINPFGIGDVLFTTPVLRLLKESDPGIYIGYWCNERVADILKNHPYIDQIFALSRGDIKKIYHQSMFKGLAASMGIARRIKKEKFDIALDFSLDDHYSYVSRKIGIKRRIGFNYKLRGRYLTDKLDLEGYSGKHVVEHYLDLLKFLDIQPKVQGLELFVPDEDSKEAGKLLVTYGIKEGDLVIGVAPGAGASWGKDAEFKRWPPVKFARIADKIVDNFKAKIVLLGDESEKPIADTISGFMRNKPVDLVGKTSLVELAAVISRLKLLISNDGGPLHMAVALGIKTVSIFGPVDELVYGPYPEGKKHIVVTHEIQCRPCYKKFRLPECKRDKVCITAVSIEDVYQSVRGLLA
ncbi:MAG: glycosyltransferase family 9 protein [Candidatus Omnitrophica bacterium]|nr:glycosyltransferase family 9 protein [Candidatus Omnitrophota bacterium]